jgi:hypothetical protein
VVVVARSRLHLRKGKSVFDFHTKGSFQEVAVRPLVWSDLALWVCRCACDLGHSAKSKKESM